MNDGPYNTIKTLDELSQYAGKIVSFERDRYGYCKEDYHSIGSKIFGYIHNCPQENDGILIGYGFSVLYNKFNSNGRPPVIMGHGFSNEDLQAETLKVALATEIEIDAIRCAIKDGKAQFPLGDYVLMEILKTEPNPDRPYSKMRLR